MDKLNTMQHTTARGWLGHVGVGATQHHSELVSDLVNSVAGRVDGRQLLEVVPGVTQRSQGPEHVLHRRMGSLCRQLLGARAT